MPSKYIVRNFTENSYCYVFNQGVERRDIFLEDKDYRFFQTYLFIYLKPLKVVLEKHPDLPIRLHSKNLSSEVELVAYCLMPNSFHLLLKQKTKYGISKLMKQITNAYTLFFNQKNKRSGSLMQGRFKAVGVTDDNLLIQILRYIHLKPVAAGITSDLESYQWSSYADYMGKENELPCSKEKMLSYFKSIGDFEKFHTDQADYSKELEKIKHLTIEG
ncbi:hypothetical protein A2867_02900 [Candidatus Daviesbacteria bacterium RIFCSPHIGHO2_01_FULL_40_11]|uniref:Transposase IS200-like domain-containing protein n=1 Tax=Candidatus Daviesbacteria bacterium RIFCSPHIGHO2_01_FULL_40_11 TaxID=1797762 RepID=A0A1F5JJY2_9BACT|nr:MAG: hypothetical protein A2867_02900 [Candidatus Daviesbacteria bacterium RIFCSPHIGHO2_01_FULL_40_11]